MGGGGREGEKDRGGPQCLKCVDTHADLPIIKQLLTLWHFGAPCTIVPESAKIDKNSK